MDRLPTLFSWIILDSPPLLFAADANLLSTLYHGNSAGGPHRAYDHRFGNARDAIAVNAVRRGELYSKYTYLSLLLHAQRGRFPGPFGR